MPEDIVKALGHLSLGTRLKRLGDRLQMDTQRLIDELDLPVAASQCPLLAAIDRAGKLTIGELTEALGTSQPGVTRTIQRLNHLGMTQFAAAGDDRRRRIVELTSEGEEVLKILQRELWPRIDQTVSELCRAQRGSLLEQLEGIESALRDKPLYSRTRKSTGANK